MFICQAKKSQLWYKVIIYGTSEAVLSEVQGVVEMKLSFSNIRKKFHNKFCLYFGIEYKYLGSPYSPDGKGDFTMLGKCHLCRIEVWGFNGKVTYWKGSATDLRKIEFTPKQFLSAP